MGSSSAWVVAGQRHGEPFRALPHIKSLFELVPNTEPVARLSGVVVPQEMIYGESRGR
jgi:hypothetical protein